MKPFLAILLVLTLPTLAFAGHWKERVPKGQRITVTFHSTPEGALFYANDARTLMGSTPIELVYQLDGSDQCQIRQGGEVRWASGATATVSTLSLCPERGSKQTFTFSRSEDAPGLVQDTQIEIQRQLIAAQTSLQRQQIELEQEQLATLKKMQRDQAIANAFQAFQTGFQNGFYNSYLRRPISCHSYRMAGMWFTNCS